MHFKVVTLYVRVVLYDFYFNFELGKIVKFYLTHLKKISCLSQVISTLALVSILNQPASAENLTEVYDLALNNDPVLLSSVAQQKAGKTLKMQALSVLLPQISGNYTSSEREVRGTEQSFDTEFYQVSVSQNLFNLAAYYGLKQANANIDQSDLSLITAQQDLIVRVSESYFNVLRGADNLASAKAEERAIARQLEQTQQRYEVGLIAITAVHEAQAAYDLAVANRLTFEIQLGVAKEELTSITGKQHGPLHILSDKFPIAKPSPESPDEWEALAKTHNTSIKTAKAVLDVANQNKRVKTSGFLPVITGFATYKDDRSDSVVQGSSVDGFETTDVGFQIDLPIFTGGKTYSERKQAGYERVARQADLVNTQRQVSREVRSSYLTTLTDSTRVNAQKRAVISAQSALDATKAGYDNGTRNIVDLLDAQKDLYNAERDYSNSRYDYIINSLNLKRIAGVITQDDVNNINKWLESPKFVSINKEN